MDMSGPRRYWKACLAMLLVWLELGCSSPGAPHAERREPLRRYASRSGGEISCLTFSTRGHTLAAGTSSGKIHLLDTVAWSLRRELGAHQGRVNDIAFSCDGTRLASVGDDGVLCLWGPTGRPEKIQRLKEPLLAVAFQAKMGSITTVDLYGRLRVDSLSHSDATSRFLAGQGEVIRSPTISSDGLLLGMILRVYMRVIGTVIRVFDLRTGTLVWEIPVAEGKANALASSHDGRVLASLNDLGLVQVWETDTGQEVTRITSEGPGQRVLAISGDLRSLAIAGNGPAISVCDVVTGREFLRLEGAETPVRALAFSEDGRVLVAGTSGGSVYVWEVGLSTGSQGTRARIDEAPVFDDLWSSLGEREARAAYEAIWALAAMGGGAACFLEHHLAPFSTEERERVRRLVRDLGSKDFALSESAFVQLRRIGSPTEDILRQALLNDPLPGLIERGKALLEDLQPPFRHFPNNTLRRRRALLALELVSNEDACRVLEKLKESSTSSTERAAADRILDRLDRRSPGEGSEADEKE